MEPREQLAGMVLDFRDGASGRGPAVRLIVKALVPDERLVLAYAAAGGFDLAIASAQVALYFASLTESGKWLP